LRSHIFFDGSIDKSTADIDVVMPLTKLKTFNQQESTVVVEAIPFHDIFNITDKALQVDVGAIMKKDPQASNKVRRDLIQFAEEVEERQGGVVTEYNWSKVKGLEFQDHLSKKRVLHQRILECQCNKCPDLKAHVSDCTNKMFPRCLHFRSPSDIF
jgi:antiviral helicase SKI2